VSFDTASKTDQAVIGLRKLAEDEKVLAVIGPFSSAECRVVFPAAERAKIVSMSMASSAPKLAAPYTYALRNTSDEAYLFQKVMKTLRDKKFAMKTAAVAYATDDVIAKTMGEGVLPSVLKQYELKGGVTFQTQAFDLSAQVSRLKPIRPTSSRWDPVPRSPPGSRRAAPPYKGRLVAGSTVGLPTVWAQFPRVLRPFPGARTNHARRAH
jgi:branched-chain amino acid transport system substrate-binding protein